MEWGLAELLRNPTVMTKLQNELDTLIGKDRILTETDLPNMPYLEAVTKEVFQLHPTTPLSIPRKSMEVRNVLGFKFPTKTKMFVNIYAIQRDPMVWEWPLEFDYIVFQLFEKLIVSGLQYLDLDVFFQLFNYMQMFWRYTLCEF